MKNKIRRALALVLPLIALVNSQPAHACSFGSDPYFTYTTHPDLPLDKFARGQLGILQPTYARSYLFVAYRYLSNEPLSDAEQKTALDMWNKRLTASYHACDADTASWLKERATVPGVSKLDSIETSRPISDKDSWQTFCNCQTDAFESAAKTLKDLTTKYGADSAAVKDWVKTQDDVFSNCGRSPYGNEKKVDIIPEPLPASADAALQKYRNYQIAAANFYCKKYDVASKQFDAIAADKDSPWQNVGAYLSVRCLIRQATIVGGNTKDLLTEANDKLQKLATETTSDGMKTAIVALTAFVEAQLSPADYAAKLVTGAVAAHNIGDLTFTLDNLLGGGDSSADDKSNKQPQLPASLTKMDAVDWVMTMQDSSAPAKKHAVERWKQTHSVPWLVAAIMSCDSDNQNAPALLAAAKEYEHDAPAKWTLFFEADRIKLGKRQDDAVRTELDQVLNNPPADLPEGALNQLRTRRIEVARNLDDFIKFGIQTPLSICSNGGVEQVPDDMDQIAKMEHFTPKRPTPEFTFEAGGALDNQVPLSVLADIASKTTVPKDLRNNVAWTSWVRAVLIGDDAAAQRLATIAKPLNSKKTPLFDAYLAAGDPASRKFAASFLMMHFSSAVPNPFYGPLVDDGYGDASGWWWNEHPVTGKIQIGMGDSDSNTVEPIDLPWLTDAQTAQTKKELAKLEKVTAAPNYFASVVLPFAKTHPADPRIPEALHWFVKSTRYGNTDDATKQFSKEAFNLLHTKYKTSAWTQKTPYYY